MADSVPEKLGKYKIIEEVGRGGFAAVYKAVDTTLNRTVALKCLAPHLLWDPTFVQRFQREAEVAANLDHPHVVTIYEVGQIEGVYFIAMQFLAGRTLSQTLEAEGPLPVSQVQTIIEQIASALDYAHARGLVHRDIKPSNIIVADDGRATLTDFGLVKAGEGTKLSTTGVVFGTPEYMSPEQAEGGKELDARSDIYSLGVVLFEMLAGRIPFVADTPLTVMYKHVHEPPPLDELPSDLPQGVVAVVEKALAKEPADRFESVGQMVKALQRAVAKAPVPAEEVAPPPPMVVEKPEPEVAPPPLEKEAVPFWQRVPLWGAIGGGLAVILIAAAVYFGRRPVVALLDQPTATPTSTGTPTLVPTYTRVPTDTPVPPTPLPPTPTVTLTSTPTQTPTPLAPTNTPTPVPPKEQIVTLNYTDAGWVAEDGQVFKYAPFVGDDGPNRAVRAFLAFDLSSLAGASIVQAKLDLSDYELFRDRDPFVPLGHLHLEEVDWGPTLDSGDFNAGATASLATLSNLVEVDSPIDITGQVVSHVASGTSDFRIRLRFETATNGDLTSDSLSWYSSRTAQLTIRYYE